MKIYAVGGAVRDELLGLRVSDRDYVVVGGTPEEMERLGYKPGLTPQALFWRALRLGSWQRRDFAAGASYDVFRAVALRFFCHGADQRLENLEAFGAA